MAAYLRFYQFDSSPFDGSVTKRGMVLGTQALKGALARVKQGLEEGAPRICLNGSKGLGKTSFGRALPKLLANDAVVAVVLDPNDSWDEIRVRAGRKFGLENASMSRKSLVAARPAGKRFVLVFDQAEQLCHETLDHLDILLQYKDDNGEQLVHCVMLANLDAAASGTEIPLLWWLDKFTTLQLQFSPIPVEGIRHYVEKHLAKAGWAGGELFTPGALRAIHANTGGVPGSINALCERILVEGGLRGVTSIDEDLIDSLCGNDLGGPAPAAKAKSNAKPAAPAEPAPDQTGDFSIGDFATSGLTAQEMLDDPNAQASLDEEPAVDLRGKTERAPQRDDLASLIMTQDSPDLMETHGSQPAASQSESLELENEPDADKFADLYEETNSSPRRLVGLSKPGRNAPTIARPKKRWGGAIAVTITLAAVGWFIYSQLDLSPEVIESAETRIEKVLEKTPKLALKKKPQAVPADDELEEEFEVEEDEGTETATLPPSLLDRADEMVADPNAKLIPIPNLQTEAGETGKKASAGDPAQESVEVAKGEAARSESGTAPATPAAPRAKPSVKTTQKAPTTDIPEEMLVINEYTAIPEAAASAPKLPVPDGEDEATNVLEGEAEASAPARIAPSPDAAAAKESAAGNRASPPARPPVARVKQTPPENPPASAGSPLE